MPQKLPIGIQDFRKIIENNFKYVDKTSVSKFSKVGIFSGLNNLQDITTHPRYATMLGYTQTELEDNFAAEIVATAEHLKLSREELLQKLKYWYNGYCFHANEGSVYNPVSINLFFNTHDFRNYWFETGTPTFLINLLKQHGLYNFSLEAQDQIAFDSFELEDLRPYGMLYQTGYLTIDYRDEYGLYHLKYPNHEVENSMAYLLENYGSISKDNSLSMDAYTVGISFSDA